MRRDQPHERAKAKHVMRVHRRPNTKREVNQLQRDLIAHIEFKSQLALSRYLRFLGFLR